MKGVARHGREEREGIFTPEQMFEIFKDIEMFLTITAGLVKLK